MRTILYSSISVTSLLMSTFFVYSEQIAAIHGVGSPAHAPLRAVHPRRTQYNRGSRKYWPQSTPKCESVVVGYACDRTLRCWSLDVGIAIGWLRYKRHTFCVNRVCEKACDKMRSRWCDGAMVRWCDGECSHSMFEQRWSSDGAKMETNYSSAMHVYYVSAP